MEQFFENEVLAPLQKAIVILTAQFQTICVKFWATPTPVWVLELCFWIYAMVCPVVISVHPSGVMCSYPFFSKITDVKFVNEMIPVIMTIFHLASLLPLCAFIAESSFGWSSHVPSGPVPLRGIQPAALTWWTGFLLVASAIGSVGVFIVTYMFHGGTVVVTSPICYMAGAIVVVDVIFFICAITKPHGVNREFDHPGVRFQQLITLPN